MVSRPARAKTHRFLEVLALLTLTAPWFTEAPPLARLASDPISVVNGLAILFVTLAQFLRPIRRAAWWVLLAAGLFSVAFHSDAVEGTLLVLLGAFLVIDSEGPTRRVQWFAGTIGALVVVAQVTSCLLNPGSLDITLFRWLVIDALLAVLIVTFRADLLAKPMDLRPTLSLVSLGLTGQEGQILQLFRGGGSSKEIAVDLGLSDGRIRNQLTQIYRKLGVANGKELMTSVHSHQVVFGESK